MKVYALMFFLVMNLVVLIPAEILYSDPMQVRIKDIAKIIEARDNQLFGFGLVIGLRNTGDSKESLFTRKALTNLLSKLDIASDKNPYSSRNVAAVVVTATLPPFIKKGQYISVSVSSIGDASSLIGGTLLMTPLKGADNNIYAVSQGTVVVGGIEAQSGRSKVLTNQSTVGQILNGAIVEMEVPVIFLDQQNFTIVLNDPNFITASRIANALADKGFVGVKAVDANTVKVPISAGIDATNYVDIIAQIEAVRLVPDSSSRIVINSKTGTIVIGEMVRLFPVAITHGNISIQISDNNADSALGLNAGQIVVEEKKSQLVHLSPDATLASLVEALNAIGATPKDLISIIQALKESGSLIAEVEIL